jgi:hypothetical protein
MLPTNWAGNFHRALDNGDASVCFRNKLRSGFSGTTQVGLPTCCQFGPSTGGSDLWVRQPLTPGGDRVGA